MLQAERLYLARNLRGVQLIYSVLGWNGFVREIQSMFVRCNVLIQKFSNCSLRVTVIVKLFQWYCLCFYDIVLWSLYHASSMCEFRSCYNKCLKLCFGYKKYESTTKTLLETGLPSFDTACANTSYNFRSRWSQLHGHYVAYMFVL